MLREGNVKANIPLPQLYAHDYTKPREQCSVSLLLRLFLLLRSVSAHLLHRRRGGVLTLLPFTALLVLGRVIVCAGFRGLALRLVLHLVGPRPRVVELSTRDRSEEERQDARRATRVLRQQQRREEKRYAQTHLRYSSAGCALRKKCMTAIVVTRPAA